MLAGLSGDLLTQMQAAEVKKAVDQARQLEAEQAKNLADSNN